jgi:hypothetical protein
VSVAAAPDYVEPLRGWRVWIVTKDDSGTPRLRSVVQKTFWPARRALVAECRQRRSLARLLRRPAPHDVPSASCQCGIYAAPLTALEPLLADAPWESGARVVGEVSLWGDVVECERGWRASHAYPAHLYVPERDERRARVSQRELVAALGDYGVPVEPLPCSPSHAVARLASLVVRSRSSAA